MELDNTSANNVAREAIRREIEILKKHYRELIEAKDLPHPFEGEIKIK